MSFEWDQKKRGPKTRDLRVNDPDISWVVKERILSVYGQAFLKNAPKVIGVIQMYMSRNASKFGTRAPTQRIPFTDYDKMYLFKAAGVSREEIQMTINEFKKNDIDLRNRVINDPFNILCSILISWYYQNKDTFPVPKNNNAYPHYFVSIYLTTRFYCSLYVRTFRVCDPNPEVMDYTIENVSSKFLFKNVNNVYDIIEYHARTNVENMVERVKRGADIDIVYFNTNLNTRLSNLMKTLAKEFYKNNAESNKTQMESASKKDQEDGDFYVGSTTNVSSILDSAVRRIVLKFISDTVIDSVLLDAACAKTKFSKSKMLIILTKIREANPPLLRDILVNIISYYLISSKKSISAIRSSDFPITMIKLYGVSNTKNETILAIKELLTEVIVQNTASILKEGNQNMVDRVKNSLYVYLVLFISKNIE